MLRSRSREKSWREEQKQREELRNRSREKRGTRRCVLLPRTEDRPPLVRKRPVSVAGDVWDEAKRKEERVELPRRRDNGVHAEEHQKRGKRRSGLDIFWCKV